MKYIIFDLDGVILSERRCFDVSAIVLWEFFTSDKLFHFEKNNYTLPFTKDDIEALRKYYWMDDKILAWLKHKGINSNVDMIYAYVLGTLGYLMEQKPLELRLPKEITHQVIEELGKVYEDVKKPSPEEVFNWLKEHTKKDAKKQEFFTELIKKIAELAKIDINTLALNGSLYALLDTSFSQWYVKNEDVYPEEETIVPIDKLKELFEDLQAKHFTLCIGTGRPLRDVQIPLQSLGLWRYFAKNHVATYDDALIASIITRSDSLDKPHPFIFRAAWWGTFPEHYEQYIRRPGLFREEHRKDEVYVVGDSIADVQASRIMGIPIFATLTGLTGSEAEAELKEAGATNVIKDVLDLKWYL